MSSFPLILEWHKKLDIAHKRVLYDFQDKIDFASNDYLGFSKNQIIKNIFLNNINNLFLEGSGGSRLISGNRTFIENIENKIAAIHCAESALIYSSGYQANIGLFSCIASKHDLYLIDEEVHASIYDGIRLSYAKHFKFQHNDFNHLKKLIDKNINDYQNIFVVVESLYSMEGDTPNVSTLKELIDNKKVFLIVDETHGFGVLGEHQLGLFNKEDISKLCVARIIGYGKAFGFSGAAIVGSKLLKEYLINFSRSFIFSTALPLYHYQIISLLYDVLKNSADHYALLLQNINTYLNITTNINTFSHNRSPIQYFRVQQNHDSIQKKLLNHNIYAKIIFPPTVIAGKERVRISLHSFNTKAEITQLINTLSEFI